MLRRLTVIAACGAAALGAAALAVVAPVSAAPVAAHAKTLVFCSDISYPPEEFFQSGKPAGSDIDIATQVAKRLGMQVSFANTGFDGIVAALLSNKCDAVISGMNDTPARAKTVAFVDYLSVGQSLISKKGNPLHINTPLDVCGKVAGAQVATTNLQTLQAFNKQCLAKGKPAIKITAYKEDTLGIVALKSGQVDVYESDSPPAVWYTSKNPSLAIVGAPIQAQPVGIALNPSNKTLKTQIQKAISAMYKDGTMKRILAKWHMTQFALKK